MRWFSAGTDEPRDQQADLPGGYWAEVGPDTRLGWGWSILQAGDPDPVESGNVASEDAAKLAVDDWVTEVFFGSA